MTPAWHVVVYIDPKTLAVVSAGLAAGTPVQNGTRRVAVLATYQTRTSALAAVAGGAFEWLAPVWDKP